MRHWPYTVTSVLACHGCSLGDRTTEFKEMSQAALTSPVAPWDTATIQVCWETDTATLGQRQAVRDAVDSTWGVETGITFKGWNICSSQDGLRIRVSTSEVPHTAGFGAALNGLPGGIVLNFEYSIGTAVTEFGHALGFAALAGPVTSADLAEASRFYGGPRSISTIASGSGRADIFYRGDDNALWHQWRDVSSDAWVIESLGGVITSDPAAVSYEAGRIDVFARADNAQLVHNWMTDNAWHGWESLGGVIIGSPTAASWGPNRIDVFVRDSNNAIQTTWYDGNWHSFQSIGGGPVTGTTSAASWAPGRLDLFGRGDAGDLLHWWWEGGPWGVESLGGVLFASPTAISWGPGRLDVFVRAQNGVPQHASYSANAWSAFATIPGAVAGTMSATSWGLDRIDLFARDATQDTLRHIWCAGTCGTSFFLDSALTPIDLSLKSGPSAVNLGPNKLEIISRGLHGSLWRESLTETGWQPVQLLGIAPGQAFPPKSSVWQTDGYGQPSPAGSARRLSRGADMELKYTPLPSTGVLTVDPGEKFQTITGFGASLNDASAWLLHQLKLSQPTTYDEAMSALFQESGIAMSYMRIPMGANDFVHGTAYTYDDTPNDFAMNHFSIAPAGHEYVVDVAKDAVERSNTRLRLMATPWSPPAWMKVGNTLLGGSLIDSSQVRETLADYFIKTLKSFSESGIPLHALTLQNEPLLSTSSNLSCQYSAAELLLLATTLRTRMAQQDAPAVRLLTLDHNYEMTDYAFATLPSAPGQSSPFDGTAFHCYADAGDPDPVHMSALHNSLVQQGISPNSVFFTECTNFAYELGAVPDPFDLNLMVGSNLIDNMRNWAKTYIYFNLVLDQNSEPGLTLDGSGDTCSPECRGQEAVLTVNTSSSTFTFTKTAPYYAIGQFSKFVPPGSWRIGSTNGPELDPDCASYNHPDTCLKSVAFQSPDCNIEVVVINRKTCPGGDRDSAACSRQVVIASQAQGGIPSSPAVSLTIPGRSMATIQWQGAPGCAPPPNDAL